MKKNKVLVTALAMVGAVSGAVGFKNIAPLSEHGKRVVTMPIIGEKKPTTNHYVKVYKVPNEKGKRTYSKIVTRAKAERLVKGRVAIDNTTGKRVRVPLSRTFVEA